MCPAMRMSRSRNSSANRAFSWVRATPSDSCDAAREAMKIWVTPNINTRPMTSEISSSTSERPAAWLAVEYARFIDG
ncbi:hypothetical protein D3C75_972210 [compost metagenome]